MDLQPYMITRQGQHYVTAGGLLYAAHERRVLAIRAEVVQAPTDVNGHLAVCKAIVETATGTFTAHDDASPQTVHPSSTAGLIQIAAQRAKVRALRDALGVMAIPFDELPDATAEMRIDTSGP